MAGALVRGLFLRNRRAPNKPVPDWLPHEAVRFAGNTGADVSARWFPAKDARAVVVLVHPDRRAAQHWFVATGWVDVLHDAGHHVLTFDLPGYGGSHGGSTYFLEDVLAAVAYAKSRDLSLPLHVVGVSLGAFAVANASPRLVGVDSILLESPYPTFNAWYGRGPGRWGMAVFDFLFRRTRPLIRAETNLAQAAPRRIFVTAPAADRVTPAALSRAVAAAGPADRTRYLEVEGVGHLQPFPESANYRRAVLSFLAGDLEHAGIPAGTLRSPTSRAAHETAAGQPA